jgi:hypothetical protein
MLRHLGATLPETVLERSAATILARASHHAQSGEETVPYESDCKTHETLAALRIRRATSAVPAGD